LRDISNYVCVENHYDLSNCRVTVTGCGEVAEVYVFPWSDPTGKGGYRFPREAGRLSFSDGRRRLFIPFISSALEGRLAPAIAEWGLINLDDYCGPRDSKALLAVPSQGLSCTRGSALGYRGPFSVAAADMPKVPAEQATESIRVRPSTQNVDKMWNVPWARAGNSCPLG